MFEMQVRCVWVILNKQVRVNFSTNCKRRHIYLSFSEHQIPSKSCPKVQEMAFQRLQISKFQGGACPRTPQKSHAFGARFSRLLRWETSHKNPQIYPWNTQPFQTFCFLNFKSIFIKTITSFLFSEVIHKTHSFMLYVYPTNIYKYIT